MIPWRPGLQPRHVPWLGIEPATLWFAAHIQSTELYQPGLVLFFGFDTLLSSGMLFCPFISKFYLCGGPAQKEPFPWNFHLTLQLKRICLIIDLPQPFPCTVLVACVTAYLDLQLLKYVPFFPVTSLRTESGTISFCWWYHPPPKEHQGPFSLLIL